jgi:hypothetical protein
MLIRACSSPTCRGGSGPLCGAQGGAVVQNSGPDPFEVSDAGTMLAYLKSAQK